MSAFSLDDPAGGPGPESELEMGDIPQSARHDRVPASGPLSLETSGLTVGKQLSLPWIYRDSLRSEIVKALRNYQESEIADKVEECHTKKTAKSCKQCGNTSYFWNRCDRIVCPLCASRLVKERHKRVKWWVAGTRQAKHVTLTIPNFPVLTKESLKWAKHQLRLLRQSKFARGWKGGFWSLEITNEGRGWHVHFHLLIEARWIEHAQLKKEWGKRIEVEKPIVWVKDCRRDGYLAEVAKYVCKVDQISRWEDSEIVQFARALQGTRTFGVFGSCYDRKPDFDEWVASLTPEEDICDCGACDWHFRPVYDWEDDDDPTSNPNPPPPRPENPPQPTLGLQFTPSIRDTHFDQS